MFSKHQQVSRYHLVDDFGRLSAILDFSEGLLSLECGKTEPVKVLNVNEGERPQMITLPNIRPMMNITVSPGTAFIFGGREKYFMWKKMPARKRVCMTSWKKSISAKALTRILTKTFTSILTTAFLLTDTTSQIIRVVSVTTLKSLLFPIVKP